MFNRKWIFKLILFGYLIIPVVSHCKTLVFSTVFNRPDFIQLQYALLQKLLKDEFQYLVFCDANTPHMDAEIRKVCDDLAVQYIKVPQYIHDIPYLPRNPAEKLPYHNPNIRHCNAVQWAWNNYVSDFKGYVLLIDSDMFPIRPFTVKELLGEGAIGGVCLSTRDTITNTSVSYLSLMLIMFDMENLPEVKSISFNCGIPSGTGLILDSGGWTAFYLKQWAHLIKPVWFQWDHGHTFYCPYRYTSPANQPKEQSREVIVENLRIRGFTEQEIELVLQKPDTIELLCHNRFLHYRAGSNYEKYSVNQIDAKTKILNQFFHSILELP